MRLHIGDIVSCNSSFNGEDLKDRLFTITGILDVGTLEEFGGTYEIQDYRSLLVYRALGNSLSVWGIISSPNSNTKNIKHNFRLNDQVRHPCDNAPFFVSGITHDLVQIEGDWSGGTSYSGIGKDWVKPEEIKLWTK